MTKNSLDIVFTFDSPAGPIDRHFNNTPLELFYHLRRLVYKDNLISINAYYHGTNKRAEKFCSH